MDFQPKYFDPLKLGAEKIAADGRVAFRASEAKRDVYVYSPRVILALNVALATNRPLLISGEPGSGKSTLAQNAAAALRWWYYKEMITSRTQAADLLWTFDALRRLNDANTAGQQLLSKQYYVDPGKLWWALNPTSAQSRGGPQIPEEHRARDPGTPPREAGLNQAVILLDEIDKADPDVPNDLLEAFDLQAFTIRETNAPVKAERQVLLVLTTNGERELPPAFLRRCVSLTLDPPTEDWFVEIADQKYAGTDGLHRKVAQEVMKLRKAANRAGMREPSTGEYLDALEVCRALKIGPDSKVWSEAARNVLWKHERAPQFEEGAAQEE